MGPNNVSGPAMMRNEAETLRQEIRTAESRVNEYLSVQIPPELFRYTLNQMRTIRTLYALNLEFPDGVQLKVLAEKLHVTPAAASEMVDTLVRKGAVRRRSDPAARRAVLLQVDGEIRERFEQGEKALCLLTGNFLATLTEAEVATVLDVAGKFARFVGDEDNFPEIRPS